MVVKCIFIVITDNSMYYHNGKPFSTYDRDYSMTKCAGLYSSGWWYKDNDDCVRANLNGEYLGGNVTNDVHMGIIWKTWRGQNYSLKSTEMKIRRI